MATKVNKKCHSDDRRKKNLGNIHRYFYVNVPEILRFVLNDNQISTKFASIPTSWCRTHFVFQCAALGNVFEFNPCLVIWLAIELDALDILVFR